MKRLCSTVESPSTVFKPDEPGGACLARASVADVSVGKVLVELRDARPNSRWASKESNQFWFEEGALIDLYLAENDRTRQEKAAVRETVMIKGARAGAEVSDLVEEKAAGEVDGAGRLPLALGPHEGRAFLIK